MVKTIAHANPLEIGNIIAAKLADNSSFEITKIISQSNSSAIGGYVINFKFVFLPKTVLYRSHPLKFQLSKFQHIYLGYAGGLFFSH